MRNLLLLCASLCVIGCSTDTPNDDIGHSGHSEIEADESVVFFRTAGWLDETRKEWHLPIHGWIYEPEDSVSRKTLFATVLRNEYSLVPSGRSEENFSRRVNLMIADNERGKRIVVSVAGRNFTLPPSGANGHFEAVLKVPVADVSRFEKDSGLTYTAVTAKSETRTFAGEVLLVGRAGLSIISDIDDTVKISNVADRQSLLEHTFLLDFDVVPHMPRLYTEWLGNGGSLHFVSSSPWQLYEPLKEFLDSNDFPPGALSLKSVRFRDETLFDLFKKGTETKPEAIENILSAYPERKFILVGDSGEQDPEVYSALARKHPDQVIRIYIRNVTQKSADNDRFAAAFAGIAEDSWQLFEDPLTLKPPGQLDE